MGAARQMQKVGAAKGGRLRGSDGRYAPREKRHIDSDGKADAAAKEDERRLRPRECAGHLRRELAGSFRSIVRGFVKQAESGSVQHLKLTTEILDRPTTAKRRQGSAQRLLEELQQMGREKAEPDVEDVWQE